MIEQIHHLNCTTFCPCGSQLLLGKPDAQIVSSQLVCHCLLIKTSVGLVLVDTGLGTQDMTHPYARLGASFVMMSRPALDIAQTAIAQIKALGYAPEDVKHIIPTHMDLDHVGGIADFPQATVHVFTDEFAAIHHPKGAEKLRYRAVQWRQHKHWQVHLLQGKTWHGFHAMPLIPELGDDILLIPLAGHTRGHCGVAINTKEGWLLHCGDAYFHHAQMHALPDCPKGLAVLQTLLAVNNTLRLENLNKLHQLANLTISEATAAHEKITLFCAHDALEFQQLSSAQHLL